MRKFLITIFFITSMLFAAWAITYYLSVWVGIGFTMIVAGMLFYFLDSIKRPQEPTKEDEILP